MMFKSITLDSVTFEYEAGQPLLKEASFGIPANENVWIVGSAGAGKSALLKILAALVMPQSGSVLVNGSRIEDMSFEEFTPFRLKIGYAFDYGGLLANRSIRENLLLPLQYHGLYSPSEINDRVDTLLKRFNIDAHANKRPAAVSGSVRKTANIARCFLNDPEVLLLDDPFTGLDRDGVITLLELISERKMRFVLFASRGESVSHKLATCQLKIENQTLSLSSIEIGKAAG